MDLWAFGECFFLALMAFPTWLRGGRARLGIAVHLYRLSTGLEMGLSTTLGTVCLQQSSRLPIETTLLVPGEVCDPIP